MDLLRIGNRGRWPAAPGPVDAELVGRAAADLTLREGETSLSVFQVETSAEAEEVALRFALTARDDPRNVDYVVFPSELASTLGLAVAPAPMDDLDPYLSERHHEIQGLTPELSWQLAENILHDSRWRVERFPKSELLPKGADLCRRDHSLRDRLRGQWARLLTPIIDSPGTGD